MYVPYWKAQNTCIECVTKFLALFYAQALLAFRNPKPFHTTVCIVFRLAMDRKEDW